MLSLLTNAVNVLLLLLVALVPCFSRPPRRTRSSAADYWLRSLLGIGAAVALAESGKHWQVWPGRPTFPSGHETLALAAATCLVAADRRWLGVTLPLTLLQAWALVTGHFHTPADVAGALLTGPGPALLAQTLYRRRE